MIISVFSDTVLAEPIISNIDNIFIDGNNITIYGSGFGVKENPRPLISSYDDGINSFSNMPVGQNPSGNWTSTGDGTSPIPISDSPSLRRNGHSTSKKVDCLNSYPPYYGLVYFTPPNTSRLYISWWHYRDDTEWHILDGSGNNNKFFRYYWGTGNPVGSPVLSVVDQGEGDGIVDSVHFSASDNCRALSYNPDSWSLDYAGGDAYKDSYYYASISSNHDFIPHLQQWDHHELYLIFSSSGDSLDAKAYYWFNGKEMFRASNFSDSDFGETTDGIRVLVFGHVSGAIDSPSHEYLDNVYIDNTLAHIIISNKSSLTYPDMLNFTHNEIQVPISWSDNSITFTANQGSFNSGD